jgi:hypothetical protein
VELRVVPIEDKSQRSSLFDTADLKEAKALLDELGA